MAYLGPDPIVEKAGGTHQSTYTTGDTLYASAANTLSKLAIGTAGQVMTVAGGVPSWAAGGGGVISSLPDYYSSADPVYASTTTSTVKWFTVADTTNSYAISKTAPTTLDISTTGLNGIAVSATLSGTVSVVGTTAVVGTGTTFTTSFQVGDVIYIAGSINAGRRIKAITNNLNLVVESNWGGTAAAQAYHRGGLAPNVVYNCYAISQAAGATPGLLLSTRNTVSGDTLVDLPATYTLYRQMLYNVTTTTTAVVLQCTWSRATCSFGWIYPIMTLNGAVYSLTFQSWPAFLPSNLTSFNLYCGSAFTVFSTNGSDQLYFGGNFNGYYPFATTTNGIYWYNNNSPQTSTIQIQSYTVSQS